MKTVDVVAGPHLRKELLETMEVVWFGYESDGRESEAKEFGTRSKAGSVAEQRRTISQLKRGWRMFRLRSRRVW